MSDLVKTLRDRLRKLGLSQTLVKVLQYDFGTVLRDVRDNILRPYGLTRAPRMIIADWIEPDAERRMCLWSREQVALALA